MLRETGAVDGNDWFMLKWAGPIRSCHITIKELAPIVVAAAIWGKSWRGKAIHVQCDNSAVVSIINHGMSKNRCLAFIMARMEFCLRHLHKGGG